MVVAILFISTFFAAIIGGAIGVYSYMNSLKLRFGTEAVDLWAPKRRLKGYSYNSAIRIADVKDENLAFMEFSHERLECLE